MASTIFTAFSLCMLSVAFSLPLAPDSKSVLLDSVDQRRLMESSQLDIVTVLSHGEDGERDTKLVKSLDSVSSLGAVVAPSLTDSAKHLRRIKRNMMTGAGCPEGMFWFTKCVTYEEYEVLMEAAEV